ncbi:MAG: cytochrome ubiquinol oxidase subunit I [Woeseiaceae bacterium]|nr:cytochrome ubiquinol oxidase subunit I [Woeseiaceae bacterium]
MDALILARIQFAANITFHILFPTITMGPGLAAGLLQGETGSERRQLLGRRLSLLGQGVRAERSHMGVVSGITMSFQFGTNWPGFMERRRQRGRATAGL